MNFVILPSEGKMSIDNASLEVDTTEWISNNVDIVVWRGSEGSGFIEYNDRPRILQKIDKLEDYEDSINAWIDVASKLPAPINLSQARQIKQDMVEAFYSNKRIKPYGNYDGSDEAVRYMAAAVAAFALPNRINELFATVASAVNYNVDLNSLGLGTINPWLYQMYLNWATLSMISSATTMGVTLNPAGSPGHGHSGSIESRTHQPSVQNRETGAKGFQLMLPVDSISIGSGGAGTVDWQPLTGPRTGIDANQFRNVLGQIINRRNLLNRTRIRKRGEIEALLTIPAVIAYSASAGWP